MPEATAVEERKEGLTAEQQDKVKRALELLYPLFEEGLVPDVVIAALGKLVGYPLPEGVQYPQPYPYPYPYPKTGSEGQQPVATETKGQEPEPQPQETAQAIEKSEEKAEVKAEAKLAPEIELLQKARDELQRELEELRKALEEERSAREKKEFVETIKSEMPSLMALAPELADLLFALRKGSDQKALETFKKLEAVVAASPLFKELGSAGHVEESPWDILEKQARELLEKGQAKTIEAARVMVLTRDPELYRQLRG